MPEIETSNVGLAPPELTGAMRLEHGRLLHWYEWGPAAGTPIIFCTGAAMSGWLGFGTDCLVEHNLRLLAPDRPGLGQSDPHPNKTLASWADDMWQFCAFNRLDPVLTVGFSQGAPFALALAASGLVSAAAIVSGQDDLRHPNLRPLLYPDVEGMLAAIEQDPTKFEQDMAAMATAEGFWDLIIGMSGERDRLLYESPDFATAYRETLQQGFAQGASGYARDLVIAMGDWPLDIEAIAIPVDLWYGRQDTSPVHSPDFGATLAARLQHATLTVAENEGGSILWTQSGDILRQLKSHLPHP